MVALITKVLVSSLVLVFDFDKYSPFKSIIDAIEEISDHSKTFHLFSMIVLSRNICYICCNNVAYQHISLAILVKDHNKHVPKICQINCKKNCFNYLRN